MRLLFLNDIVENESLRTFAKWILDIVDGKSGCDNIGEAVVEIPNDICIQYSRNHIFDIVSSTYRRWVII